MKRSATGLRSAKFCCTSSPCRRNSVPGDPAAAKHGPWTRVHLCSVRNKVPQQRHRSSASNGDARFAASHHVLFVTVSNYFSARIDVTTPAPTVRPPSRIAKRIPFSIAIGFINSTVILIRSPGIAILFECSSATEEGLRI
jgi:hypothetical protein